jgi:predicted ATPase
MERSDERCWEPALHRIRGELLLARGAPVSEVEDALQRAISTAQGQQARSLEARAAAVLRHLWQTQGRDLEVRDRLAAVYGAIPGAFRTPQPGRTSPPLDDAGS